MELNEINQLFIASSPFSYPNEQLLKMPSDFARKSLFYFDFIYPLNVQFPFSIHSIPNTSYLILYTKEGSSLLTYGDQTLTLMPQSILLVDCHTSLKLELKQSTLWKADLLLLNGSHMKAYYEFITSQTQYLFALSPTSTMDSLIQKLYDLVGPSSLMDEFIISKIITDILTELIVNKEHQLHPLPNIPKYLLQIKSYFDKEYASHISLDELAATYQVNKYKIVRDFGTYYHTSPINYLIDKRITEAKKLLIETDYPVCDIASQVGIENINHFTNLFKKSTHLTPNYYRKNCQLDLSEYNK